MKLESMGILRGGNDRRIDSDIVGRLYYNLQSKKWSYVVDGDAFPNLNRHGLNESEDFDTIELALDDFSKVTNLPIG